jgi:hypothetical protein
MYGCREVTSRETWMHASRRLVRLAERGAMRQGLVMKSGVSALISCDRDQFEYRQQLRLSEEQAHDSTAHCAGTLSLTGRRDVETLTRSNDGLNPRDDLVSVVGCSAELYRVLLDSTSHRIRPRAPTPRRPTTANAANRPWRFSSYPPARSFKLVGNARNGSLAVITKPGGTSPWCSRAARIASRPSLAKPWTRWSWGASAAGSSKSRTN